jgi:hypothetical protein
MRDIIHLSVLAAAIFVGYLLYRHYRRTPGSPLSVSPPLEKVFNSHKEYTDCLTRYGVSGAGAPIPEGLLPLHASITAILNTYEAIRLHPYTNVFCRSFLSQSYEDPGFVCIGEWGDGSRVLVRRCSEDPHVYIDDVEECSPGRPRILASSFEAYIYASMLESMKW